MKLDFSYWLTVLYLGLSAHWSKMSLWGNFGFSPPLSTDSVVGVGMDLAPRPFTPCSWEGILAVPSPGDTRR